MNTPSVPNSPDWQSIVGDKIGVALAALLLLGLGALSPWLLIPWALSFAGLGYAFLKST